MELVSPPNPHGMREDGTCAAHEGRDASIVLPPMLPRATSASLAVAPFVRLCGRTSKSPVGRRAT